MKGKRRKPGPHRATAGAARKTLPEMMHRAILLLAGVALLSPLIVGRGFYVPHVFLKSLAFRACVELMLVLYIILAAAFRHYRPQPNRLLFAAVAYFGLMLAASLPGLSANAWSSWWGDFARMDGMITQLHLLAFFIILASTIRKEREWLILMGVSVFAALMMGASGMVQDLSPGSLYAPSTDARTQGAAGNAGFFAAHLLLNLFLAIILLLRSDAATYARLAGTWLGLLLIVDMVLLFRDQQLSGRGLPGIFDAIGHSPGAVTVVILVHVLVIGWFIARRLRTAGYLVLGACGAFSLWMIQSSATRGALVGLAAALLFAALAYATAGTRKPLRLAALGLTTASLLLGSLLFLNPDAGWIKHFAGLERLVASSAQDGAVAFRLLGWKASARGFLERPLLGWGRENFRYVYDRHFPEEIFRHGDSDLWADRAHDIFIGAGINGGAGGLAAALLLYGLMLGLPLAKWVRSRDPAALALAALVTAYLVHGLFWFDSINTYPVLFLVLAYISRQAVHRPETPNGDSGRPVEFARFSPAAGTAVLAVLPAIALSGWFSLVLPYQSNTRLVEALGLKRSVDPGTGRPVPAYNPAAAALFEELARTSAVGMYEAREEFARYALELGGASYIPAVQRAAVVRRAVQLLDASILQDPQNVRHYQFRAVTVNLLLRSVAEADPVLFGSLAAENLEILDRAKILSPTRAELHLAEADTLFLLNRGDERLAALERGAELSPANKNVQLALMRSYISAGKADKAAEFWGGAKHLPVQWGRDDYEGIIELYRGAGALTHVAALYEEQLALGHDQAAILPRLAAAYRDLGNFDLARKTAGRALAAAPQLRDEVQALLESIDRRESEHPGGKRVQPEP